MPRFAKSVAVLLVQLLPALVGATPPDRDVNVVNTPLPVFGEVTVTNTPAVQQGGPWVVDLSGPVAITSLPPVSGAVAVTSVPPVNLGTVPELAVRIVNGAGGAAAPAPEPVYLFLKADGVDVKGDSTVQTLGRKDSIECLSFGFSVLTAREAGSGLPTGRRQYQPIVIRKRIDRSSPILLKALIEAKKIDATFKFYRPDPSGDGTTDQYYTVEIKEGAIVSIGQAQPDLTQASAAPLEDVSVVFKTIRWTIMAGGITTEDSWSGAP
jgi:type VI secretion system secreted protein Hcp